MIAITTEFRRIASLLLSACLCAAVAAPSTAATKAPATKQVKVAKKAKKAKGSDAPRVDRSGKPRRGKASYYARSFAGKKMADGTPMNPNANIAASRTLPLGTTARVTNLENGKSSVVEIRDRGPYVDGRIVDLSPKVAKKLDMIEDGVAPVVVTPLSIPGQEGGGTTDLAEADTAEK